MMIPECFPLLFAITPIIRAARITMAAATAMYCPIEACVAVDDGVGVGNFGTGDGVFVGATVGVTVGVRVGVAIGDVVGAVVGVAVGRVVGAGVGVGVGEGVGVGVEVGVWALTVTVVAVVLTAAPALSVTWSLKFQLPVAVEDVVAKL